MATSYITQKFVDVGRKVDGVRRPSGEGLQAGGELDTLQYDSIIVRFPSMNTSQPNSLVSLKPNSIRHLIMLSISTTWLKTPTSLWPQMPQIMS